GVFESDGLRDEGFRVTLQIPLGESHRTTSTYRSRDKSWRAAYELLQENPVGDPDINITYERKTANPESSALILGAGLLGNRGSVQVGARRTLSSSSSDRPGFVFIDADTSFIVTPDYAGIGQSSFGSSPVAVLKTKKGNKLFARGYTEDGVNVVGYSAHSDFLGAALVSDTLAYTNEEVDYLIFNEASNCIIAEDSIKIDSAYRSVTVADVEIEDDAECVARNFDDETSLDIP
ncbi:MAG: hypothetical protein AAGL90_16330, partial [Pseudomonadota bacterium]